MKQAVIVFTIVISIALIGVPLLINFLGNIIAIKTGASFGDWLGFWGSYLGGFVTLAGVYLAFILEHKKELKYYAFQNQETLDKTLQLLQSISKGAISMTKQISFEMWLDFHRKKLYTLLKQEEIHPTLFMPLKDLDKELIKLSLVVGGLNTYKNHSVEYKGIANWNMDINKEEEKIEEGVQILKEKADKIIKVINKDFNVST